VDGRLIISSAHDSKDFTSIADQPVAHCRAQGLFLKFDIRRLVIPSFERDENRGADGVTILETQTDDAHGHGFRQNKSVDNRSTFPQTFWFLTRDDIGPKILQVLAGA
jgi:hypothetical protein